MVFSTLGLLASLIRKLGIFYPYLALHNLPMKRLTYISKFSTSLSGEQIQEIGETSRRNNSRWNITGILICSRGIFFQIIEGDNQNIEKLYSKILRDERHTDIVCLKTEENIQKRMFPDWSMETIDLDKNTDVLIMPIKTMLNTITESRIILEKYTQPSLLKILQKGVNPLRVEPQKVERIIMFCDLMSFSHLTEIVPVQELVEILNQFFTICSSIINRWGGEVTKFIGDCVMAYFKGEQGDEALQASLEIINELANFRDNAPPGSAAKVLYSGIGLAKGTVIQGNIGSSLKQDYTIIGDAVNTAQRLEALTRDLPYFIAFSADVKKSCRLSRGFIEVGNFQPKGKEETLTIYSLDRPLNHKNNNPHNLAAKINKSLDKMSLS